jgi:GDP-L-fucose synthase
MKTPELQSLPEGKIYVAGHRGMVGSAVVRALRNAGHAAILTSDRTKVDLCNGPLVEEFIAKEKPALIVLAAAKVGGIHANNTYPADFIYENLAVAVNVIGAAFRQNVPRLLFLGSSCIYPRLAPQPMKEEALLTSALEPTNEPYAVAKIAGLKLCEAYRRQHGVLFHSMMPTNLYGPNDNYHPQNSHVLPALIRRFHEAKVAGAEDVTMWGTGEAKREFMHVDDLAASILHVLRIETPPDVVNAGTGEDVRIREVAEIIKEVVGFRGPLKFDTSKPDGAPRKLLDVTLLNELGWKAKIGLREGIERTYQSFLEESGNGSLRSV